MNKYDQDFLIQKFALSISKRNIPVLASSKNLITR